MGHPAFIFCAFQYEKLYLPDFSAGQTQGLASKGHCGETGVEAQPTSPYPGGQGQPQGDVLWGCDETGI